MSNERVSRRAFLSQTMMCGAGIGLGGLAAAGKAASAPVRVGKPNFLVIVADDMGYSDAGCYGGEIETPNLDKLAANGLRFTQHYSTGRCWPSRACILTGYYAQQVRMDPPRGRLPAWTRVLPHYLKPLGYRSYASGKWHLRGAPKPVADGGFDRSYVMHDGNRFFSPKKHELDDRAIDPIRDGTDFYVTTAIAEYATGFLKEHHKNHRGKPFCLYLAFTSPHFPLHALRKDIDRYRGRYDEGWDVIRERRWRRMRKMGIVDCSLSDREPGIIPKWNFPAEKLAGQIGPGEAPRAVAWKTLTEKQKAFQATKMAIHAAMIDRMDREIGRVLDQVKAMGALANTVIVFVSDNGASAEQIIRGESHDPSAAPGSWRSYLCLGPGWSTAANTPFSYHKSWVHEGGISSPMIVHWPAGLADKSTLRHTPGHFVDLLPTMVELAGGTVSPTWKGKPTPPLAGRSLAGVLTGADSVKREFLFFHHSGNRAIRMGDWKLVSAGRGGKWELYGLRTDRGETTNLAAKYPDRVREISQAWTKHEKAFRKMAASETLKGQ